MSDHKALVERLNEFNTPCDLQAADAIEQLERERDAMKGNADDAHAKWVQAVRERDEALEALRAIDRHNDSPVNYDAHINSLIEPVLAKHEVKP